MPDGVSNRARLLTYRDFGRWRVRIYRETDGRLIASFIDGNTGYFISAYEVDTLLGKTGFGSIRDMGGLRLDGGYPELTVKRDDLLDIADWLEYLIQPKHARRPCVECGSRDVIDAYTIKTEHYEHDVEICAWCGTRRSKRR
ncbi:MAG: hypothetical protein E7Z63_00955 [Thermoplasmata archaeon]|nr:hypothetical protein [Thermoplasmata archaeon]